MRGNAISKLAWKLLLIASTLTYNLQFHWTACRHVENIELATFPADDRPFFQEKLASAVRRNLYHK
jgi:hypothetical protein